MHCDNEVSGDVFRATIRDQLTFSDHAAFRNLLEEINKSGAQKCVFDLSNLIAVDSAGLGMFVIALHESKKSGWSLTIQSPQGRVLALMTLAKFDKLLTIKA